MMKVLYFLLNRSDLRDFSITCNGKILRKVDYKKAHTCRYAYIQKISVIEPIDACYNIQYAWYVHTHLLKKKIILFFALPERCGKSRFLLGSRSYVVSFPRAPKITIVINVLNC